MSDLTPLEIATYVKQLNVILSSATSIPMGKFLQHTTAVLSPTAFQHKELWTLVTRDEVEWADEVGRALVDLVVMNQKE